MSSRVTTSVRRTAACLTLAGAGVAFAGGGAAWATAPTTPPPACGTAAHPALYRTVHHDLVPAVTHAVTVVDRARVPGTPGIDEVSHEETTTVDGDGAPAGEGWSPTGTSWVIEDTAAWTEHEWARTVIDQAATVGSPGVPARTHEETVIVTPAWEEKVITPAVPEVREVTKTVTVVDTEAWDETVVAENGYAYVQKQTGKLRYRDSGSWNGEDNDHGNDYGWFRAPEHDTMTVIRHDAETHEETVVVTPYSPAVPESVRTVQHEAVTRTITVTDVPAVPATEATPEVSHPETDWTRDAHTAPPGEGWVLTGQRVEHPASSHTRHEWARTVVDTPAVAAVPEVPELSHTETVVDVPEIAAWDEQVLESEATPAGPACPTAVLEATAPVAGLRHRGGVHRPDRRLGRDAGPHRHRPGRALRRRARLRVRRRRPRRSRPRPSRLTATHHTSGGQFCRGTGLRHVRARSRGTGPP